MKIIFTKTLENYAINAIPYNGNILTFELFNFQHFLF